MKTIRILFGAICAFLILAAPAFVRANESATADLDAQIDQLTSYAKVLEMQTKLYKSSSAHPKTYRKRYKSLQSKLKSVQKQISELQAKKVSSSAVSEGELFTGIVDETAELRNPPDDNGEEAGDDNEESDEDVENDSDDGEDEDDEEDGADEDEDDDEPETDPTRRWLEEFIDGKLAGVSDQEWTHALYNAYFEAYEILKSDPVCPPDLLAEVSALCEQFRAALEAEKAMVPPENSEAETQSSSDDGEDGSGDDGEDEDSDTEDVSDDGSEESEEEGVPEEEGEPEWNGPYLDAALPQTGSGGSGGGGAGSTTTDDTAETNGTYAASSTGSNGDSWSGGSSTAPSTMNDLYGRGATAGESGGGAGTSIPGAGVVFGLGDTADASVATNFVDDIPFEILKWKFGGFRPPTNAVRSTVTVSSLKMKRDGMSFKWVRNLGAWGIPYEVPDALACLFVKTEDGEWVGGKFEWISSSRSTRQFTNIREGYHGWTLRGVPKTAEAAFVIFRKDGKQRSNIVVGVWER